MVKKKKTETSCDFCNNLVYDDEIESYVCDVNMDEDDLCKIFKFKQNILSVLSEQ